MIDIPPSLQADWSQADVADAPSILRRAHKAFDDVVIASSFSLEDITLMQLTAEAGFRPHVIALDTGRLHEETYACADAIQKRTGARIEWMFPERQSVESLEREKGLFSFRESVENRRECCRIRKVEPLTRALEGRDAWITGQRREQSVTRRDLPPIELDATYDGLIKINPLYQWTLTELWDYVRENDLPYNVLHDQGFPSIGCAPCTRAVSPGEDQRAGRWWWEQPEHKECGLHIRVVDGKTIASKTS